MRDRSVNSFQSLGAAASIFLLSVLPVSAASVETPEDFLRRIYARFGNDGPGVSMRRPEGTPFYTADLLDLVAKDEAGGAGSIDWDPICACQAYENFQVRTIAVSRIRADAVAARVVFDNLGARHTVHLTLSRTPAGWRVADVESREVSSVVALLRSAVGQPTSASHRGGVAQHPK